MAAEIDTLIEVRVDGVCSNGSAGEFHAQTEGEFDRISQFLAEKCNAAHVSFQIAVSHMSAQIPLERLRRVVLLAPGAAQVILPDLFPVAEAEAVSFLHRMAGEAEGIGLVLCNPPYPKKVLKSGDAAKGRGPDSGVRDVTMTNDSDENPMEPAPGPSPDSLPRAAGKELLIAAPLTGFLSDGNVDLEIIPAYARMLHANSVGGVFINGTTGEGLSLTIAERRVTAERWVQAAPRGFKVIVHVGHVCQKESQALTVHAATIGASAVGEIGPVFYRPPSVAALADYIAATAAAAPDMPYYYYHMPAMNQVDFPMIDLLKAVGSIPNFAGVKYTFDDLDDYQRCTQYAHGRYDILFGRDELRLEAFKRGATGAVGSTYSFMAPIYQELIKAVDDGDETRAQRMQNLAIRGIGILTDTGAFFSAAKAVLRAIGLPISTSVSRPLSQVPEDAVERMMTRLQEAGVTCYLNMMQDRSVPGASETQHSPGLRPHLKPDGRYRRGDRRSTPDRSRRR